MCSPDVFFVLGRVIEIPYLNGNLHCEKWFLSELYDTWLALNSRFAGNPTTISVLLLMETEFPRLPLNSAKNHFGIGRKATDRIIFTIENHTVFVLADFDP